MNNRGATPFRPKPEGGPERPAPNGLYNVLFCLREIVKTVDFVIRRFEKLISSNPHWIS
jgi:hypothetical protein